MPRSPNLAAALTVAALTFTGVSAAAPMSQTPSPAGPANVRAHTVASFPAGTWLENLIVEPSGGILVTSYLDGKVYRVQPSGTVATFATLPGTIAGIARVTSGGFLVVGWKDRKVPSVFHLSATGALTKVTALSGAMFPNGICLLQGTRYLIADSYRSLIWEFDAASGKSSVWLADSVLSRTDTTNATPGVNGVRRQGAEVYLTSTQRGMLLRVPVDATGK